jgi:hypothetical protein
LVLAGFAALCVQSSLPTSQSVLFEGEGEPPAAEEVGVASDPALDRLSPSAELEVTSPSGAEEVAELSVGKIEISESPG